MLRSSGLNAPREISEKRDKEQGKKEEGRALRKERDSGRNAGYPVVVGREASLPCDDRCT